MRDKAIRVLIADDNKVFCDALGEYINKQKDFRVVAIASNGTEAYELIKKHEPDIALIDIVMPYIDGLGVLEKITYEKLNNRPVCIMVSSMAQEKITHTALYLGAQYYVIKPFDMAVLIEKIRQIMHMRTLKKATNDCVCNREPIILNKNNVEDNITQILDSIKVPRKIRGYIFLREAITMAIEDRSSLNWITRDIYPVIANKYLTTNSRVERGIRYAIIVAWNTDNIRELEKFLGCSEGRLKEKPTNAEFIAIAADRLRL